MSLTIAELIDQLSNLGTIIGLHAEVKAWHLTTPGSLPPQPLDVRGITGCAAGWDKTKNKPLAYLKVTQ